MYPPSDAHPDGTPSSYGQFIEKDSDAWNAITAPLDEDGGVGTVTGDGTAGESFSSFNTAFWQQYEGCHKDDPYAPLKSGTKTDNNPESNTTRYGANRMRDMCDITDGCDAIGYPKGSNGNHCWHMLKGETDDSGDKDISFYNGAFIEKDTAGNWPASFDAPLDKDSVWDTRNKEIGDCVETGDPEGSAEGRYGGQCDEPNIFADYGEDCGAHYGETTNTFNGDTFTNQALICGPVAPVCNGYIQGGSFGTCGNIATRESEWTPRQCAANFGETGNTENGGHVPELHLRCDQYAPYCKGYSNGVSWGQCSIANHDTPPKRCSDDMDCKNPNIPKCVPGKNSDDEGFCVSAQYEALYGTSGNDPRSSN